MNLQDAPHLIDDFTVGFAKMGSGDYALGGGAVEVGTPIVDDTVTDLLRCGLVANVGYDRVKGDIRRDRLGRRVP